MMTCFLTFLIISAASFISLYLEHTYSLQAGQAAGEAIATLTEDISSRQAQRILVAEAEKKAKRADHVVRDILSDAEILAMTMTEILTYEERYHTQTLKMPEDGNAKGNKAYVYLTNGFSDRSQYDPEILETLKTASDIAGALEYLSRENNKTGAKCYVAGEEGYFIWADGLSNNQHFAAVADVYLNNEYEPTGRPWYIAAKTKGRSIITDVYQSVEGFPEVTGAAPYYNGDTFAGVAGVSTTLDALYELVQEKTLGDERINFALDSNGRVVISTQKTGVLSVGGVKDLRLADEKSLAIEAASMAAGKSDVSLITMEGEEYYIAYAPMPSIGWSYGTLVKRDIVIAPAKMIRQNVAAEAEIFSDSIKDLFFENFVRMTILLFFILIVLVYVSRRVARRFVRPLIALAKGVRAIAKGDINQKLDIRTGDEIEGLADCVNEMTDDLKRYMKNLEKATAERERIKTELSLAKSIQGSMLPSISKKISDSPYFDLAASMEPAREVGGDFYDFYFLDEDHLALTVADVSGKGVPAALFMVISKTILKNTALSVESAADLGSAVERTNRQLCENNDEMMFVTAFVGVLNIKTGEFSYVNAGHNPPLVGRTGMGSMEWSFVKDKKKNYVLGAVETASYRGNKLILKPGDMLFLYTDGVTEAMDKNKKMYTAARLKKMLESAGTPSAEAKEVLEAVRADIASHVKEAKPSDDVTMIGIRFLGA